MKKYLSIFLVIISAFVLAGASLAADTEMPETPGVEAKHIVRSKIDSTGGIQLPSSLNLEDVNKSLDTSIHPTLDEARGPDVLGKCGFYRATATDLTGKFCQDLYATFNGGTAATTAAPNTPLPVTGTTVISSTTAMTTPYSDHTCAKGTSEGDKTDGKCSGVCYNNDTYAETGRWGPGGRKCLQQYYITTPPASSFCQPYGSDSDCRGGN